ncbi:hypothetical protein HG531_005369 [Fusarium graminearum]|nr:hypothetical protein HG531_005369 [Fusarium graminearum]
MTLKVERVGCCERVHRIDGVIESHLLSRNSLALGHILIIRVIVIKTIGSEMFNRKDPDASILVVTLKSGVLDSLETLHMFVKPFGVAGNPLITTTTGPGLLKRNLCRHVEALSDRRLFSRNGVDSGGARLKHNQSATNVSEVNVADINRDLERHVADIITAHGKLVNLLSLHTVQLLKILHGRSAIIHINIGSVKADTLRQLARTGSVIDSFILLRGREEITSNVSVDDKLLRASTAIPSGLSSIRESSRGKDTVFGIKAAAQTVAEVASAASVRLGRGTTSKQTATRSSRLVAKQTARSSIVGSCAKATCVCLLLGVSKETTASVRLSRSTTSKQTAARSSRLIAEQPTRLLLSLVVLATEETGASSLLSLVVVLAKKATTGTGSLGVVLATKEATARALCRIVGSESAVRRTSSSSKPTCSSVGVCVAKTEAGTSRFVLGVAKETTSRSVGVRLTKASSSRVCCAETTCCASISSSAKETTTSRVRLRSVAAKETSSRLVSGIAKQSSASSGIVVGSGTKTSGSKTSAWGCGVVGCV